MAKLIKPPRIEDVTVYLRILFAKTEDELIKEILRKRDKEYVDYAEVAALERVQQILQNMVDESWAYVPAMIEKIFYKGLEKHAAGYANARSLTAAQTTVVRRLANNLLGELLEAAETAEHTTRELLTIGRLEQDPFREATLKSVLRQQAAGNGVWKSASQMAADLNNKGITAFVDKAGRKWRLRDYSNMAVRTTARQAEVTAILTADPEHDLYKITKIGSTCPVCAPLEGRVYSRSGTNPDYPPLSLAFGKIEKDGSNELENTYCNIHPNCLHAFVKYTTTGKSEKEIQKDKDFSDPEKNPLSHDPRSKKQIEEYRKKVAARQKYLQDKKQFQRYQEALGDEVPKTFQTFLKHKLANDPKYKSWKKKYRNRGLAAGGTISGNIPEHRPPVMLEKIDVKDNSVIQSTLEKYEKAIWKEPIENAVVITQAGDVKQCFGVKNQVLPNVDLGDEIKGAWMTHNHPWNETHYSFSAEDLTLFSKYKLSGLRGVDDKFVYCIKRLKETVDLDEDEIVHLFSGSYYHIAMGKGLAGEIDLDFDEYHEIVKLFAKKCGFQYERSERK